MFDSAAYSLSSLSFKCCIFTDEYALGFEYRLWPTCMEFDCFSSDGVLFFVLFVSMCAAVSSHGPQKNHFMLLEDSKKFQLV